MAWGRERGARSGTEAWPALGIHGWLEIPPCAHERSWDTSRAQSSLTSELPAATLQDHSGDCEEQYLGAAAPAQDAKECGDPAIGLYSQMDEEALTLWKVVSLTRQAAAAELAPASPPSRRVLPAGVAAAASLSCVSKV